MSQSIVPRNSEHNSGRLEVSDIASHQVEVIPESSGRNQTIDRRNPFAFRGGLAPDRRGLQIDRSDAIRRRTNHLIEPLSDFFHAPCLRISMPFFNSSRAKRFSSIG